LRRSFATLSLLAGQNLFVLQAFMGHSDIATTRKYVELIDRDLINAHKEHGPVDRFLR
jgi:integrase/recombinase XerD